MKNKRLLLYALLLFTLSSCSNEEETQKCSFQCEISEVTDCQGHTYPVTKIGEQFWMAENLQCTKYDTESEMPGVELTTSSEKTFAPYYCDGRKTENLDDGINYSCFLTEKQKSSLGLLYNWAAAVGIADEQSAINQTSNFDMPRQGICPNGWHLPTKTEWEILKNNCGLSVAGKNLKVSSGWYIKKGANVKNDSVATEGIGVDKYCFSALPAGCANGQVVNYIGTYANFWSATPDDLFSEYAFYNFMVYYYDGVFCLSNYKKSNAQSVRCVKN